MLFRLATAVPCSYIPSCGQNLRVDKSIGSIFYLHVQRWHERHQNMTRKYKLKRKSAISAYIDVAAVGAETQDIEEHIGYPAT